MLSIVKLKMLSVSHVLELCMRHFRWMQMWVDKRNIYWHKDQSIYLHISVSRFQFNIYRGLLFIWSF